MYIALDENNNRICIDEAEKGQAYFCPVCHAPLIVRDGFLNAKHFAHMSGYCEDDWNYDMSEWHRQMQSYFPEHQREVVVKKGKKAHRADVLVDKTVIEFQHSPISASEFADRNDFFVSLGYRIAWVIDVSEQFRSELLYYCSDNNDRLMRWKYPFRYLTWGPDPSAYDKKYALWLSLETGKPESIGKVVWSTTDDDNNANYKKIVMSEYSIYLSEPFDVDEFFMTKKDFAKRAIRELNAKHKYTIKYCGVKGKGKDAYVCPLTHEFGLDLFGDDGCIYCQYCYMMIQKKRQDEKTQTAIYCCYPEIAREGAEDFKDEDIYFAADIYDI
ncbi:MAG: hypothetical protein IKW53_07545 [Clostridia bacterium]|nr:hypothetical protein [Clostridia bacterium]